MDEASGQIGQLTDMVMVQLAQLQRAVTGPKDAMKEATRVMYAIRPEEEK